MLFPRMFAYGAVAWAASLSWPVVAADTYPSKPIHMIVGTVPGGATDLTARLVAQKLSEILGQAVIVENRSGADTLVATRYVKEQPADGYTLLAQSLGFSTLPYTKSEPGYERKDFTGVGMMMTFPFLMLVGCDEPEHSLAEYVVRAKKEKLTYGHGGIGNAPNIAAELFFRSAGIDLLGVPYKGNGAVIPDVVTGRVSMFFDAYQSSAGYLKAGKMRALAVAAPARLQSLPDVPTFKEQGFDFNYTVWLGLLARAGTPAEAIDRLSEVLRTALTSEELVDRFHNDGGEATFMSPAQMNDYLAKESADMGRVAVQLKLEKD